MTEDYLEKQPLDTKQFINRIQLFIAIRTGNIVQVRNLLTQEPMLVKIQEEKKVTMSHLRIASGWKSAEETMAHMAQPKMDTGWSPLRWAIWYGDRTLVELLLDHGATVEDEDWNIAAKYGYHPIIALFVEKGLKFKPLSRGNTPLHLAAAVNDKAIVELLLPSIIDIEARDEADRTPLHWSATVGHQEMVTLLLEAGANINAKDKAGRTPLYWATKNGHEAITTLLSQNGGAI